MCRMLMKGNEAIAQAAIDAGCQAYFGYPITPQSELLEYMANHLPKKGGVFIQAESELAAISMVYGAAAAGARCMTSTSSPGMSLMQEGVSYLACAELPCVIVNIMRGGPGLGDIQGAQSDYFQATHGGGHGDYRTIVLAPSTVQEAVNLTRLAFDLADLYRIPVIVLGDGMLGQMAESVDFDKKPPFSKILLPNKDWTLRGAVRREPNRVVPFNLDPEQLEKLNLRLKAKYKEIRKREVRFRAVNLAHPDIVLVAYGIVGRIAQTVVEEAGKDGVKVGLIRPVTLWPFPKGAIHYAASKYRKDILVAEMSLGQLVDDVRLAVDGEVPVHLLGRAGGMVPSQEEILDRIYKIIGRKNKRRTSKVINVYTEGAFAPPKFSNLSGMEKTKSRPKVLTDDPFTYCPGCHHSTAHRLIAEVIDELGIKEKTIGVFCVGCAVFGYRFFNIDGIVPAHGRAPAVATGIKRTSPDKVVFAYQGDGDLASIGMTETIHAANRGEPVTVIFINNGVYGMTGGQMAPTTLLGQQTSTTAGGRNSVTEGYPIKVCELLNALEKPAYIARVSLTSPKNIVAAKKAIKRAFQLQLEGKYAIVEILSVCPTNWKLSPEKSLKFIDEEMAKVFPLGVIRDIGGEVKS